MFLTQLISPYVTFQLSNSSCLAKIPRQEEQGAGAQHRPDLVLQHCRQYIEQQRSLIATFTVYLDFGGDNRINRGLQHCRKAAKKSTIGAPIQIQTVIVWR